MAIRGRPIDPKNIRFIGRKNLAELRSLIFDALSTDGAHHKQWFLEQIAKELDINLDFVDYEEGIAP